MEKMTEHMMLTLRAVIAGATSGYNYGTLKALVNRGLITAHWTPAGTAYRATEAGEQAARTITPIAMPIAKPYSDRRYRGWR